MKFRERKSEKYLHWIDFIDLFGRGQKLEMLLFLSPQTMYCVTPTQSLDVRGGQIRPAKTFGLARSVAFLTLLDVVHVKT